jgi:hypothetical protein
MTSLTDLDALTSVGGAVYLSHNDLLTSLLGLESLIFVGGDLNIKANASLLDLTGLDNLETINGSLNIEYNDSLKSLTGLNALTSIGGSGLYIRNNPRLENLTGLGGLSSLEALFIDNNDAMTSLVGLDGISSIGSLIVYYNDLLTSLSGLDALDSFPGGIRIENNGVLTSLTGLNRVTSVGNNLTIIDNPFLVNLTGLDALNSICGYLQIGNNDNLTNLSGLDNLNSIVGAVYISQNNALQDLTGLNALSAAGNLSIWENESLVSLIGLENVNPSSISGLYICHNSSLSTCAVQSICNYLTSPEGTIDIFDNAPGCNNPPEVASACGISLPCLPSGNYYFNTQTEIDNFQANYPNCTELKGEVHISGNDILNLNGLSVVTSIEETLIIESNTQLAALTGLDDVASIGGVLYITANDSLITLAGMNGLTSVGEFRIEGNAHLTSLKGLDNIDAGTVYYIAIYNNEKLSTCEIKSICDYLASPNSQVWIANNTMGCNSPKEVDSVCVYLSEDEVNLQTAFSIYPNPTSGQFNITFTLGHPALVNLKVLNRLEQVVSVILNESVSQGNHQVTWDAEGLPSGIYFYRLTAGNETFTGKMVVMK